MKLNSLKQAFGMGSDDRATSHSIHKLTLGVFALSNALDSGVPFTPQKAALQKSCAEDPLVSLAADSLPEIEQVGLVICASADRSAGCFAKSLSLATGPSPCTLLAKRSKSYE